MNDSDHVSWSKYIRSVSQIDNSNKYMPPLRYLKYSVNNSDLSFLRRQQQLINSISYEDRKLTSFSRKQKKQFRSEARLDLHDLSGELDNILIEFCTRCIIQNIRYISIITGKGRGILREKVTNWLHTHTQFVSEYFEITDSANACGSLGIHLRSYKDIK